MGALALAALRVPLLSELFGIHASGSGKVWTGPRPLDGNQARRALSPLSPGRSGSCPLIKKLMADPNSSAPNEKKELSTENRLLLAFVLMGIVLFATPYFFKQPPPPPGKKVQLAPASAAA